MTEFAESICLECPFRRDVEPRTGLNGEEPHEWYAARCWPMWGGHTCSQQGDSVCLGWAVHVQNSTADMMLEEGPVRDWVAEWGKDIDLIFDGNSQFIRYHRGEYFGSAAWREAWVKRFYISNDPPEEEGIQLSLF